MVLEAVLSGFVLAAFAPWINKVGRNAAGWILSLLPFGLFVYFASFVGLVSAGETALFVREWIPSLSISLSFYVDGWSLLFALIISGIGALVVIYGGGYLGHDPFRGRFFAWILIFMGSMLGVVLSNNLITLFVFWELTSVSSYMLIGYYHEKEESRKASLQALLVTGSGGLALLAGLVMMGLVGGSWEITELFQQSDLLKNSDLYLPILLLVLAGAFTKSAQFPFHFWLPNAMAGPAPVSTYLHSATMVKAGIYLMARFSPILGGTTAWVYIVTTFGSITMLLAAHIAWQQTDLKRILAYSTVSALGILTALLGLGTEIAIKAAVVFLVVHAFYKGCLFMVAGSVDHESGTRFIDKLGGLRKAMPFTAGIAILAVWSMSGFPPAFGFIGKELIYESTLESHVAEYIVTAVAFLTNALTITAAWLVIIPPFFGAKKETPKHAHEAPPSMLLGPAVLGVGGILFGLAAGPVGDLFVNPAVSAISAHEAHIHLALWHGLNPILALSGVTIVLGLAVYAARGILVPLVAPANLISKVGPERWYNWLLDGTLAFGRWQTRVLQSGYLRNYMVIIVFTTVGLSLYALFRQDVFTTNTIWRELNVTFYELLLMVLILAGAVVVIRSKSRLAAVAGLGVVGYGVALIFVVFGAPDLAMTQFSIETLSVILLVLVLYRLPRFITHRRGLLSHTTDIVVSLLGGGLMALLVLLVTALPANSRLSPYFAQNSYLEAFGHNVVNVILVDFRGLDTMGEITVLGIAAIGVYGLLKLRLEKTKRPLQSAKRLSETRQPTDVYPVVSKEEAKEHMTMMGGK